jgi:hypothetical protein
MLTLVQQLLRSHQAAGQVLAPSFGKWLPAVAVFWGRRDSVMLPPPSCLPPTARRDGVMPHTVMYQGSCPCSAV